MDEQRNEQYPSAPVVSDETDRSGQKPSERIGVRLAWANARNDLIAAHGARRAQDAVGGGSIGHGKDAS
jgi:hypothetical protein